MRDPLEPLTVFISGIGFVILVMGVCRVWGDPDTMWGWYSQRMRARGIVVQRTPEWENSIRMGPNVAIGFGIVMLLIGVTLGCTSASRIPPEPLAGVWINGRQLTRKEWDACGQDTVNCVIKGYGRKRD